MVRIDNKAPETKEAPKPSDGDNKAPETKEAVQNTESKRKGVFVVANGKSLTSKKGILVSGQEVKGKFFAGGQSTVDDLVKKGFIVKA